MSGVVVGQNCPIVFGSSGTAVPLTGTVSETVLATIPIPAGALGANGAVRVTAYFSMTNNANSKTPRIRFGAAGAGTSGASIQGPAAPSTAGYRMQGEIHNRGSVASQVYSPAGLGNGGWSSSTGANPSTATIDTSAATEVAITGLLTNTGDTITLEYYLVEVIRA